MPPWGERMVVRELLINSQREMISGVSRAKVPMGMRRKEERRCMAITAFEGVGA